MTRYVFIESRDPFESRDTQFVEDTAIAVKERGHDVTVFLVQNGVLAARTSARCLVAPYFGFLCATSVFSVSLWL